MRKLALPVLFVLGLLAAGALSASVVASTLTTTSSTGTGTTDTTGTTTTTPTTTTAPGPKTIAPGVTVGGIEVGGLTRDAALLVVRTETARSVVIRVDRSRSTVSPAVLGAVPQIRRAVGRALKASPDTAVPLRVDLREWRVRAYVGRLARRFDVEAQDARLIGLRNLRPWIRKERPGRVLDAARAERLIEATLKASSRGPVRLETTTVAPKVTRATLGPMIVIRRGSNELFLYNGGRFWREFPVATGQPAYPTPLGHFSIAVMWRNPWWYPPKSPWAAGAKPIPPGPGNPLGTRWMGLTAPGVGIHGTPDASSIGYSVSHGCIRMHIPSAEWLFSHVHVGTPVFIVSA